MKLISLHVDNFGKLSNYNVNFTSGLNTYNYENGYGKTTLSVFIKCMFYGMDKTTSHNLEKNERLKYAPWNGGRFGGSLTFSHNGKEYTVSRTFGEKRPADDTYILINAQTNKVSTDFIEDADKHLGNLLLGVSKETFSKSVYISLNESPSSSDEISAKLNDLVEVSSDIGNYEDAVKTLDDRMQSLKFKKGKGGEIYSTKSKIDDNNEKLRDIKNKISLNGEYSKKIKELEAEINILREEGDKLNKQMADNSKYEKKLRYEQLKTDLLSSKREEESIRAFFNNKVPSSDVVNNIDSLNRLYFNAEDNLKKSVVSQTDMDSYNTLSKYFHENDIPSDDDIDNILKLNSEYKEFKQEESSKKLTESELYTYNALSRDFEGKDISEDVIKKNYDKFISVQEKKKKITEEESEYKLKLQEYELKKKKSLNGTLMFIFLIISTILTITGAILVLTSKSPLGYIAVIIGVLISCVDFIIKHKKKDFISVSTDLSNLENEISNLKSECENEESEYLSFISKFSSKSNNDFLTNSLNSSTENPALELNEISIRFNNYLRLSNKNSSYNEWLRSCTKTSSDYENEIKAFLMHYCDTDDILKADFQIKTLCDNLTNKRNNLLKLEDKVNNNSKNATLEKDLKEKLSSVLLHYNLDKSLPFHDQVMQIHNKLNSLSDLSKSISYQESLIKEFEDDPANDIESLKTLVRPSKDADKLKRELDNNMDIINKKNAEISDYQVKINDNLVITDKENEIEEENDRLKNDLNSKETEYSTLEKARELLARAKENLDANYSAPMREGFEKYVRMFDDNKLNLCINTDLQVKINDNGRLHDSDYLSEGYKDIVNFCSRMALIDALFKDNKVPIILDDPFVNLDDEKVPSALKLINDISLNSQVLYFTCHQSRCNS